MTTEYRRFTRFKIGGMTVTLNVETILSNYPASLVFKSGRGVSTIIERQSLIQCKKKLESEIMQGKSPDGYEIILHIPVQAQVIPKVKVG